MADASDDLDSDSAVERDADAMLDYIEQFNELLEDKRYEEAAVHAANGPRGILRTQETMQRFAGFWFNHLILSKLATCQKLILDCRIKTSPI